MPCGPGVLSLGVYGLTEYLWHIFLSILGLHVHSFDTSCVGEEVECFDERHISVPGYSTVKMSTTSCSDVGLAPIMTRGRMQG